MTLKNSYSNSLAVAREAIEKAGVSLLQVKGIGITNQRETTVIWDRHTGDPVYNAIVWQCRRTAPMCEELKRRGLSQMVREKTGLPIDAYIYGQSRLFPYHLAQSPLFNSSHMGAVRRHCHTMAL